MADNTKKYRGIEFIYSDDLIADSKIMGVDVLQEIKSAIDRIIAEEEETNGMTRKNLLERIERERARQLDVPGSENDVRNTPNEWAAMATHYLTRDVRRGGFVPDREQFEENLVKAAAVILAALENAASMESLGYLHGDGDDDPTSFVNVLAKCRDNPGS